MNTDTLASLAQRVADQLTALHTRYEDGDLTRAEFVTVASSLLDGASARAVALADVALAAEVSRLRRTVVAPLGMAPPAPTPESVVTDTLDSPQYAVSAVGAVAVLGRAVTLRAAQDATQDGMGQHGIGYWTRVTNTGACELCLDLREGVMPVSQEPYFHRGCGCTTKPVEREETA